MIFHGMKVFTNLSSLKSKSAGVLEYTYKKDMEIRKTGWIQETTFPSSFFLLLFSLFTFNITVEPSLRVLNEESD